MRRGARAGIVLLKLFGALARVAFGFALASLAAGLVTVMFVNTPAEVLSQPASRLPQAASATFDLALLTATHTAIFSAAFVLIMAGIGEWFSIRALPYYLLGGMAIAALGFAAQYSSEVGGQPTILNDYAAKAFLTAGFFAGFVYWLASGQFAGKPPPEPEVVHDDVDATPPTMVTAHTELPREAEDQSDEPTIAPESVGASARSRPRYASLLNRLKFAKPKSESDSPANELPSGLIGDDAGLPDEPAPSQSAQAETANDKPHETGA